MHEVEHVKGGLVLKMFAVYRKFWISMDHYYLAQVMIALSRFCNSVTIKRSRFRKKIE
jgi:hypothetical protein